MSRLYSLFMLCVLLAVPIQAQTPMTPAIMKKAEVETEFITPSTIDRLRDSLVLKKKENGVLVPANQIDDSDWPEIFARFAWVIWSPDPLPDDARRRTNARANSQRPDVIKILFKEIDMTTIKQAFSVVISKLNDRILQKKTVEGLEWRIKTLETKLEAQKQ